MGGGGLHPALWAGVGGSDGHGDHLAYHALLSLRSATPTQSADSVRRRHRRHPPWVPPDVPGGSSRGLAELGGWLL